jgi:GNAT superfamily N-acetyltransferase
VAAVSPVTPARADLNSAIYESLEGLEDSLDDLAAAYASAGVRAWTVRVPESDALAGELLRRAGLVMTGTRAGMGMALVPPPPAEVKRGSTGWDWDLVAAGAVNDRAYGDTEGEWARALSDLPPSPGRLYLAHSEIGPTSCVLVLDADLDCFLWYVATVPEAQGCGLATGLVDRALTEAIRRGCTSTTVQSTRAGERLYERFGYRVLLRWQIWEYRV